MDLASFTLYLKKNDQSCLSKSLDMQDMKLLDDRWQHNAIITFVSLENNAKRLNATYTLKTHLGGAHILPGVKVATPDVATAALGVDGIHGNAATVVAAQAQAKHAIAGEG